MQTPPRPDSAPSSATWDPVLELWRESTPTRERMWDVSACVLDAPRKNGKLHGDVRWQLRTHETRQFAPRVAFMKEYGLPDGVYNQQISTYVDGELTLARFVLLDEERLRVPLRDGKIHGEMIWQVQPLSEPLFSYRELEIDAYKTFKVPKPNPKKLIATYANGKLTAKAFYDANGKLVTPPKRVTDWGENATAGEVQGYVANGAFAGDIARWFGSADPFVPDGLPSESTKLAELPAAHRASALAIDTLVRAKKLPSLGRALDLGAYAFDCVANELYGATDQKYFGIAYDGSGDMWLLDTSTGEVVHYAHETGEIGDAKFGSLDEFAFAALRSELAATKRAPARAVKKLFATLGIAAGAILLANA